MSEPGRSGSGGAVKKHCQYYDKLQFLLSTLRKRKIKVNITPEVNESDLNPSTSTTSSELGSFPTETPKNKRRNRHHKGINYTLFIARFPFMENGPTYTEINMVFAECWWWARALECIKQANSVLQQLIPARPSSPEDVSGFCAMLKHDHRQIPHQTRKKLMHSINDLELNAVDDAAKPAAPPAPQTALQAPPPALQAPPARQTKSKSPR